MTDDGGQTTITVDRSTLRRFNDAKSETKTDHEPDYPTDASASLDDRAAERFAEKIHDYGEGKNWRGCADGEMARAAQRKLAEAQNYRAYDRPDDALRALADALNYIRFEADHIQTWHDSDD